MMQADQEAADTPAPEEIPITGRDLYLRQKDLAGKLQGFSKSTLVLFIASETISRAWARHGRMEGIVKEEEALIAAVKGWAREGREENRHKRILSLLRKFQENDEAVAAGQRPPHRFKTRRAKA